MTYPNNQTHNKHEAPAARSAAVLMMLAGLLAGSPVAHAQDKQRPNVRDKNFEIGAFSGASIGFDRFRPMYGGNVTYAVNKWLLPYVEASTFPGLERTNPLLRNDSPVAGYGQRTKVDLYDFNGGVHLRKKMGPSNIVPYAVIGFGVIGRPASKTRVVNLTSGREEVPAGYPANLATSYDFPGRSSSAINFGAGIRWYLKENFGIRVEGKGYRTFQFSENDAFGRITFGIFYQTR